MATFRHLWSLPLGHTEHQEPFHLVSRVAWDREGIRVEGTIVDEDVVGAPAESWWERWTVSEQGERLRTTRDPPLAEPEPETRVRIEGDTPYVDDRPFPGHTLAVQAAALSPDGRFLASSGDDSTVRLWEVETARPAGRLLARSVGRPGELAWSPDGSRLAIACWQAGGRYKLSLRVFSVDPAAPAPPPDTRGLRVLEGPPCPENYREAVALPDGSITSHEKLLVRRDTDGEPMWELRLKEPVTALSVSPDGERVAVATQRKLSFFDVDSGDRRRRVSLPPGCRWCRDLGWTRDGRLVGTRHDGKKRRHHLAVYDGLTGKRLWSRPEDEVTHVAWTEDVYVASRYGSVDLLRGRTGHPLGTLPPSFARATGAPGGRLLIAEGGDLLLCEQDGREVWRVSRPSTIDPLSRWSPDGRWIASRVGSDGFQIRDGVHGELIAAGEHDDGLVDLAWSEDGQRLITASNDQSLRLWDLRGSELASVEPPHRVKAISVAGGQVVGSMYADAFLLWKLPA